jgi:hypothetical protein
VIDEKLCIFIEFLIVFQRSYNTGGVKRNTLGLKMQTPVEIFTSSVSFGQFAVMVYMAIKMDYNSYSVDKKMDAMNSKMDAMNSTIFVEIREVKTSVDELSRTTIKKFW